jgi:hypothetical protein
MTLSQFCFYSRTRASPGRDTIKNNVSLFQIHVRDRARLVQRLPAIACYVSNVATVAVQLHSVATLSQMRSMRGHPWRGHGVHRTSDWHLNMAMHGRGPARPCNGEPWDGCDVITPAILEYRVCAICQLEYVTAWSTSRELSGRALQSSVGSSHDSGRALEAMPRGVLSGPRLVSFRGLQMNALTCLSPVNLSFHYHVGQSYRAVWFCLVRIRQTGRFSRAACRRSRREIP